MFYCTSRYNIGSDLLTSFNRDKTFNYNLDTCTDQNAIRSAVLFVFICNKINQLNFSPTQFSRGKCGPFLN